MEAEMSKVESSHREDTCSSQEQTEEDWDERLEKMKHALSYWRERVKSPEKVLPGSSLATDDQIHPEMPCSQLAWWGGVSMGVEHLDGTISLFETRLSKKNPSCQ